MSNENGNAAPFERVESLNTDMWSQLKKRAEEIRDEDKRREAIEIFESKSVEEVADKVHAIRRGSWLDNLFLGSASVLGMVAGYKLQGWIDIRKNGVPITGLLGLTGVVPGLAMDKRLTARNSVGLGGLMFVAGATLYTRTNEQVVEVPEQAESEDA